jgi:hypothetical protein
MWPALRYLLSAFAGVIVGYMCLTLAANLEDWQFYTIRSLVTGKLVMSEIVAHPADRWVVPVLLAASVSLGAASGVLVAIRFRPPA